MSGNKLLLYCEYTSARHCECNQLMLRLGVYKDRYIYIYIFDIK